MVGVCKWWGLDFFAAKEQLSLREWGWLREERDRLVGLENVAYKKAMANAGKGGR